MAQLKPLSGKCPTCGKQLTFKNYTLDKEGNQLKIYVCQNENCTNQQEYESHS